MKIRTVLTYIFLVIALIFAAFKLPLHDPNESEQLRRHHEDLSAAIRNQSISSFISNVDINGSSIPFPVMSFNVRYDGVEPNPNHQFLKRLPRLAKVIKKWKPLILGLQEPFSGQIMDLQRELQPDAAFGVIGYKRPGFTHEYNSLGHKSRMHDYRTAILYDKESLELVYEDHVWLSDTPRVVESKHPKSPGYRTMTFGRFKLKPSYYNNNDSGIDEDIHVLAFNTHLDVWNEEARRFQVQKVLEWIEQTRTKFPNDPVFLFGDFNSVPGHQTHQILTSQLNDTWDTCADLGANECVTNTFAISYHHWLGPFLNTYGARAIQYFLHMLHGSGCFVITPGMNWRSVLADLRNVTISALKEGLPTSMNRLHVDWILFNQPLAPMPTSSKYSEVVPKFVAIVETVATDYASDHYPLAALFELKYSKKN